MGRAWLISFKQCIFIKTHTYSAKQIACQWSQWTAMKLKHLFPHICLWELCRILNTMGFHCNPIFVSHPVNFHLTQYVYLRPACVCLLEPKCSYRLRQHVASQTNAFWCNSANFPRHEFWFPRDIKSPIIVNAHDCEGRQEKLMSWTVRKYKNCGFLKTLLSKVRSGDQQDWPPGKLVIKAESQAPLQPIDSESGS